MEAEDDLKEAEKRLKEAEEIQKKAEARQIKPEQRQNETTKRRNEAEELQKATGQQETRRSRHFGLYSIDEIKIGYKDPSSQPRVPLAERSMKLHQHKSASKLHEKQESAVSVTGYCSGLAALGLKFRRRRKGRDTDPEKSPRASKPEPSPAGYTNTTTTLCGRLRKGARPRAPNMSLNISSAQYTGRSNRELYYAGVFGINIQSGMIRVASALRYHSVWQRPNFMSADSVTKDWAFPLYVPGTLGLTFGLFL